MMKAPIKMYYLKPVVVHDFPVELPKCMYKLTNIHDLKKENSPNHHVEAPGPGQKLDIFHQVKQFLKNCQGNPEMAQLEARQEDILAQLAQLKEQIFSLKKDLNLQNGVPTKALPTAIEHPRVNTQTTPLPENLAVTVNPSSPPYAFELLQRVLRNEVALAVTSYVHSSVVSLPQAALQVREALDNFQPPAGVPVINVRLIWKNISSNSEILLSHTLVSGEVNLLRYLSRLANTKLSYDLHPNNLEIDSLLDQCYLLVRAKTKTERAHIFQVLHKSMGKSLWLVGGDQIGLADIAAYSAIRQCGASNELNANLTKWYQKCANVP